MDGEAGIGLHESFLKRAAVMRSFASGEADWHVLLLFYSNAVFAFDCITSLLDMHSQEPSPKRNLGEAPKAATPVVAGAHEQLFYEES